MADAYLLVELPEGAYYIAAIDETVKIVIDPKTTFVGTAPAIAAYLAHRLDLAPCIRH